MATILVVDDDPNSRLLAATLLEPAGHLVLEAGGGDDALGRARERHVDLVITDLSMPGGSGVAFVRALRADPRLADIVIVLSTGSSPSHAMRDFMVDYRIAGLIEKPIEPHAFLNAVAAALRPPDSQ